MRNQQSQRVCMLGIGLVALAGLVSLAGAALGTTRTLGTEDVHQAFLKWEVGVWDATITMPADDGTSVTYEGEQVDRLGACGLWLITDLRLTGEGAPPYEGHGLLGFDPKKGKLVGVWVDPRTTWLAVSEGEVSADGRKLTLEVEGRNPLTGAPIVMEYVTTKVAEDRRRLEVFMPLPDGGRMLAARIDSARRSKEVPGQGL